MDFGFSDEQEALRASAREVLAKEAGPAVYRKAMEKSKTGTDDALWKTIVSLGWPGVAIDETLGGLGFGVQELAVLSEELGRAIAPVPFFSTVGYAAQIVAACDASPARDEFLRGVASGEKRAAVVRFREPLSPEAHLADDLVVCDKAGVRIVPASEASRKVEASLDGGRRMARVRVPAGAGVVVADSDQPVKRGLDRAAVLLAAEAVGVAAEVLERTVAYARERTQFDRAIGSFQAISHTCADMLLLTETARSHAYYAAWALDEGTPDAGLAAASAKAAAADAVRVVANDGIQVHGGIGFTWEHDMQLFYRRAKFCELFLGDAGVWREKVAAGLAAAIS
jgi:alkylation response protein AidB-like acyl-CoA dehydrogenase